MTLEQILEDGYVVAADEWLNMIVVWNGCGTFNVWSQVESDAYRNTDCFTKYGAASPHEAKQIARKRLAKIYDQMEQFYGEAA